MLCPPLTSSDSASRTLAQLSVADVWRASELAVCRATTRSTGHAVLDAELPNKGWPRSTLIELLLQQAGIGEMQLLKAPLIELSRSQRIALIQPPYIPHGMAASYWGIDTSRLMWIKPAGSADALWSTEQALKTGAFGAVLLWQTNVRNESLRRLNLAAHTTDTWFFLLRPMSAAADASPASLRIGLRPAFGGVSVEIIKRRGPHCDHPFFISLADMPVQPPHADQQVPRLQPHLQSKNDASLFVALPALAATAKRPSALV